MSGFESGAALCLAAIVVVACVNYLRRKRLQLWLQLSVGPIGAAAAAILYGYMFTFIGKWVRVEGKSSNSWWVNMEATPTTPASECDASITAFSSMSPCPYPSAALNASFTSLFASVFVPFVIWFGHVGLRPRGHDLRRLTCYACLILWRAGFMYYVLGELVESAVTNRPANCWYRDLTRRKRCVRDFDFADHIVLFSTNYLLVLAMEKSARSRRSIGLGQPRSRCADFFLEFATVVLQIICVYSQLITASFFHTPAESLVALVVVCVAAVIPVCVAAPLWLPRKTGNGKGKRLN